MKKGTRGTPKHGTYYFYCQFKCRCWRCRRAQKAYWKSWLSRNPELRDSRGKKRTQLLLPFAVGNSAHPTPETVEPDPGVFK